MISKTIKIYNHLLKQLTIRQKFVIFNIKNEQFNPNYKMILLYIVYTIFVYNFLLLFVFYN